MRGSLTSTAQLSFFLDLDVTEAQRLRREHSANAGDTVSYLKDTADFGFRRLAFEVHDLLLYDFTDFFCTNFHKVPPWLMD